VPLNGTASLQSSPQVGNDLDYTIYAAITLEVIKADLGL